MAFCMDQAEMPFLNMVDFSFDAQCRKKRMDTEQFIFFKYGPKAEMPTVPFLQY